MRALRRHVAQDAVRASRSERSWRVIVALSWAALGVSGVFAFLVPCNILPCVPVTRSEAPSHRHDSPFLEPTLDRLGPRPAPMTPHLDRGYDSTVTRERLAARDLRGELAEKGTPAPVTAVIIIVRRLVRQGWTPCRWEGRPPRQP
ncbi:MAG: hypothetical protein H0U67_14920 [Gemmatimonadetes bacterium]|nr:hypothetical protein [Gemmatimonadota bacterium]